MIEEARASGATVHFASLVDICLFFAELETKHQKYKGRVVFRGDIFQDDCVSRSIHRTRINSIPSDSRQIDGCHLQIAGLQWKSSKRSISRYSSKMEDFHKLLKVRKSQCPDIWIRLPRHKWPKSWSSMEDPVVPLERNLYGHPLAGQLWEKQFERVLLKHGWEKIPNWECLFVHREKGLFLSGYVDDKKMAGKKTNFDPIWKLLNKEVELGEPTSFLDHVYLDCTQRQCEISNKHCGQLQNHV